MKGALSIWALFSCTLAFGGDQISVAVCNVSQVSGWIIKNAETEAAYVFQSIDVEIHWTNCGEEVGSLDPSMRPRFIVRLQTRGQINRVGPASLESMGHAFMNADGSGYMVDAYYGAIQQVTRLYPIPGQDQVLGCTIAHELGHLLVGAGHRQDGIMRASWREAEFEAINRRRLKFNQSDRTAILRKLRQNNQ